MGRDDVTLNIGVNTATAQRQLIGFGSSAKKALGGVESAVTSLKFAASGIAAALAAGTATRQLANFSTAIAEVASISQDAAKDTKSLSKEMINIGAQFGKTAAEEANTYYQIISAGITDVTKANKTLIASNKLAIGGIASTTAAVDILTTAMNVYKKSNLTSTKAADILFNTVKLGKTNVSDLASSLGKVLPNANALGVSFEEVTGTIAALTAGGIKTAESVTALNALFSGLLGAQERLKGESKEVADAFSLQALSTKGLTKFVADMTEAVDGDQVKLKLLLGSVEAVTAVNSLAADGFKTLGSNIDSMSDSAGAADEAMKIVAQSFGGQVDKLKQNIGNLILRFSIEDEAGATSFLQAANKEILELIKKAPIIIKHVKAIFKAFTPGVALDFDFSDAIIKGVEKTAKVLFSFKAVFYDIAAANAFMIRSILEISGVTTAVKNVLGLFDNLLIAVLKTAKGISYLTENPLELLAAGLRGTKTEGQKTRESLDEMIVGANIAFDDAGEKADGLADKMREIGIAAVAARDETVASYEDMLAQIDDLNTGVSDLAKKGGKPIVVPVEVDEVDKVGFIEGLLDSIQSAWDSLTFENVIAALSSAWEASIDFIDGLLDSIQSAWDSLTFENVTAALSSAWEASIDFITDGQNLAKGFSSALAGREGAKKVLAGAAEAAGQAFGIAGFGQITDQLLTLGPQGAKEMVRSFSEALPDLVVTLTEALAEAAPAIVERMIEVFLIEGGAERIAVALAHVVPRVGYKIGEAIIRSLNTGLVAVAKRFGIATVKAMPEPGWIQDLRDWWAGVQKQPEWVSKLQIKRPKWVEEFSDIVRRLTTWKPPSLNLPGSGGGGLISGTGTPLDMFSKGGVVYAQNGFVPRGTDTVPAMLTPGERVLSVQQNKSFESMPALLAQLLAVLSQPMTTETSIEIDGNKLADVMLELSRQNARTAA